jgi:hypothetical protein
MASKPSKGKAMDFERPRREKVRSGEGARPWSSKHRGPGPSVEVPGVESLAGSRRGGHHLGCHKGALSPAVAKPLGAVPVLPRPG